METPPSAETRAPARAWSRVRDAMLSDSRTLIRIAVAGVALSGALGLVWALSMYPAPAWAAMAAAVLVLAALGLWLWRPRAGALALLCLGLTVLVAAGAALASAGTVPWLLVAFWAGSALSLSALLAFVTAERGPDRQDAATVVAVISILVLSAVAVTQVVRSSWTAEERAQIEALPIYGAADVEIETAPSGVWAARYPIASSGLEDARRTVNDRLLRHEWSVRRLPGEAALAAYRDDYVVVVRFERVSASVPPEDSAASTPLRGVVNVTVHLNAE